MEIYDLEPLAKSGLGYRQIAAKLGVSGSAIRYWLNKHPLRTSGFTLREFRCSCGQIDPAKFYGHKRSFCGDCHNKYTRMRGERARDIAIGMLGGKCDHCGYQEYKCSLEVHHLDPSIKDVNVDSMRSWSEDRIRGELGKGCALLCSNHHHAVHAGLLSGYLVL